MISTNFTFCTQTNESNSPEITNANQIKPLYTNRVARFFSNQTWRDTLSVDVNGESIITGEVFLKITNYKGKLIYKTSFPTRELLNHEGLIIPDKDELEIKKRIDSFFAPTFFSQAVVVHNDSLSIPDSSITIWKTIQADPTAIYFSYSVNKNTINRIVYSKILQKIVAISGRKIETNGL
ncbi:hypothetical protein [Spirosoma endbachense]|uniref:Uncharacterized protein n=1 Tax=Spirosoma endbachense TaxID=2666025 RepID=A0A6P1VL96_9BACT|nr:hypothetical protein [Spirosoma endbachense]QHV94041.1 hypothetical protein GJR95_02920 [Spirosoma endbachense]